MPTHTPWKEDALDHVEVLHEHISLGFGAQVAHRVADAQLDRTSQGRGGRLWVRHRERGQTSARKSVTPFYCLWCSFEKERTGRCVELNHAASLLG